MPILTVQLTLEFDRAPVFYKWLPLAPADVLRSQHNGIELTIEFRLQDAATLMSRTPEDFARTVNNSARRVFVSATVEISEELAECIRILQEDSRISLKGSEKGKEYRQLGLILQQVIVDRINRFIAYIRAYKQQYWVEDLVADQQNPSQFFARHEATASIDGQAIQFDPDVRTIHITGTVVDNGLKQDEWADVIRFMNSGERPPLVRTLLANARNLESKGNRRNALVEAVTALEVQLASFGRNTDILIPPEIGQRLEPDKLATLLQRVGLRGSFAVALPLLLTEQQISRSVLRDCCTAIEQRNAIVHHGQRDVSSALLPKLLKAIRSACYSLEALEGTARTNA